MENNFLKNSFKILIVDDHPMTVKGYKSLLENYKTELILKIEVSYDCQDVADKMKKSKSRFYDLVLLDICLPPSKNYNILSGEDLGVKIRSKFNRTKLIIHTSLSENLRILNIFKSLNPEGFLIKSDIQPEVLQNCVNDVLSGKTYYSQKVNSILDTMETSIYLDLYDQQILYYLSKGELTKNLLKYIPMSLSTIERRKTMLKSQFGVIGGKDKDLLDIAREKGFIA